MTDDSDPAQSEPSKLVKACIEAMYPNDAAAQMLGITIKANRPGHASAYMTVRADMTNGHAICHGGMLFTLADTAFAYASNNTNKNTVASGCTIEFIAPALQGDELTAVATERTRSGRTSVYDIEIFNQRDELIALFRGKGYQIRGSVIPQSGETS
jgi:acyl-CoA thioesterase